MGKHTIVSSSILFVSFILFCGNTLAQNNTCDSPEYRQFDFWLGKWTVRDPQGKVVGHNIIKRVHNHCALLENWASVTGFTGSSLNIYNRKDRLWHQSWVDSSGNLLLLSGQYKDGKMILSDQSQAGAKKGNTLINKISWTKLKNGSIRQLWETSEPGQPKWKTLFDGHYQRDSN